MQIEIFNDRVWQMSYGERAALEGLLRLLEPTLAIEIGSMQGASLRRIAGHAREAHSFDLSPPTLSMPDNVVLHIGDSHELLSAFLREVAAEGRNVDFVMVDGDHTAEGVRQDVEDLLNSTALKQSVILIHDSANEQVRRGLDSVRFTAWPKVSYVDLDWVPGRLLAGEAANELWCGLALVLVDHERVPSRDGQIYPQRYQALGPLLFEAREVVLNRGRVADVKVSDLDDPKTLRRRLNTMVAELNRALEREALLQTELRQEREHRDRARKALENITSSPSWKLTEPFRVAKRRGRAR